MNRTLLTQLQELRDRDQATALDKLTEEELDQQIEDGIRYMLTEQSDLYPTAEALIESYENSNDQTDKECALRIREWFEEYARKDAEPVSNHRREGGKPFCRDAGDEGTRHPSSPARLALDAEDRPRP